MTVAALPTHAVNPTTAALTPTKESRMASRYPQAKRDATVDDLHGTKVADPYRWLEDPDSADTTAWVTAENKVTFDWLARVPSRPALKARLTELWNYERYAPPSVEGTGKTRKLYFFKNDGLQNQSVLFTQDLKGDKPSVLLDPNALSADGTVALSGMSVSDDGKLLAYALASGGSDWVEWHVKDTVTGRDLPDVVKWSKFSGASWSKDGTSFLYARYPEPKAGDSLEEANYFHKVYRHTLGTTQDKDVLMVQDKEHKTWGFDAQFTEDSKYIVVHVWDGTDRRNRLWLMDNKPNAPLVKLFDDFDASYGFVGNVGSTFFITTDLTAPRQRLVSVDVDAFAKAKHKDAATKPVLTEIVAQHAADKLEGVAMIGGGLLVTWLQNAHNVVSFHSRDGKKLRDLTLPAIGTTSGFEAKQNDMEAYYAFTSFTYPTVVYHLDLKTGVSTEWKRPTVKFNPDDYETQQVFFSSVDGTKIPMFIVHKKGLKYDGTNPTYLYGYGGFNISLTPAFSVPLIAWLERGGVFAQPSLRGGGEFGEEWHQAGMLKNKQNVFDDFTSAARYLVASKITSSARLAIGGGSNGGLLCGASITQHPELFGAAVCMVGVMDMLRFHKFTIGHAWVSEYGSADDKDMFPTLLKYSPLHNLKKGTRYPATLITTADHDDRVVPAHSFKFAAAIQDAQAGQAPVLIRVDVKAGHGAGKPTSKMIDEAADRWSFLLGALDVEKLQ